MKAIKDMVKWFDDNGTFDGRDKMRLGSFLTEEELALFGISLKPEYIGTHKPTQEWTREGIIAQLKEDVAFGFEKALNQRGISASCMYEVVKMWNYALEEGLEDFEDYPNYGLPLFKATAIKYGFENPIDDDYGDEEKYEECE